MKRIPLLFALCLALSHCATQPDGTKTFLGLDAPGWAAVGKEAGKAALQTGAATGYLSYSQRRSAKEPVTGLQP